MNTNEQDPAVPAVQGSVTELVPVQCVAQRGPAALPLYQKMGFVPYARETRTLPLEARPPRS